VLPGVLAQQTPLGRRARALSERAQKNVVVVALAAKLARIVWAVCETGVSTRRPSPRRREDGSAAGLRI
jgi:hypothetical protein